MGDCPNKATPKPNKKACEDKVLTTIKIEMILQAKKKSSTREVAASIHHQALLTCVLCHEVTSKAQAQVRAKMMMKNFLMNIFLKLSCFSKKFALSKRNN